MPDRLSVVAALAGVRAGALHLAETARLAGGLHDFGKFASEFDLVLQGKKARFDRATVGAKLVLEAAPPALRPAAELIAMAILGNHAGLPDSEGDAGSMARRIDGFVPRVPPDVRASTSVDLTMAAREIAATLRKPPFAGFDLSVAGRMGFSCLVGADFRDTEAYYGALDGREPPATGHRWPRSCRRCGPRWRRASRRSPPTPS